MSIVVNLIVIMIVDQSLSIFIAYRSSAILPIFVIICYTLKTIVESILLIYSHAIMDYRSDGAALVRSMKIEDLKDVFLRTS